MGIGVRGMISRFLRASETLLSASEKTWSEIHTRGAVPEDESSEGSIAYDVEVGIDHTISFLWRIQASLLLANLPQ